LYTILLVNFSWGKREENTGRKKVDEEKKRGGGGMRRKREGCVWGRERERV
jgi:hypothetical protein